MMLNYRKLLGIEVNDDLFAWDFKSDEDANDGYESTIVKRKRK